MRCPGNVAPEIPKGLQPCSPPAAPGLPGPGEKNAGCGAIDAVEGRNYDGEHRGMDKAFPKIG